MAALAFVPLAIVAGVVCWYAVLSLNHVIEESLWALMKHDTKVSPIPTSNRSLRARLVSWHCESVTTQTLVPEVLR
jgi:hypothetical protein